MENTTLLCPACKSPELVIKYEAKYVYSYIIDNDAPGLKNTEEFLPYLYDGREQTEAKQYIECRACGSQYPCFLSEGDHDFHYQSLQHALQKNGAEGSHPNG